MYPFDGYLTLYQHEDLPDQINILGEAWLKLGAPIPDSGKLLVYEAQENETGENFIVWDGDGDNWNVLTGGDPRKCLINDFWQDQFADTYTISGPISGTVTRESICVWAGANLRLTNFGYQWRINGNSKAGDQNTPVGSYAGGFTVS